MRQYRLNRSFFHILRRIHCVLIRAMLPMRSCDCWLKWAACAKSVSIRCFSTVREEATVSDAVDHIDYIVNMIGIDFCRDWFRLRWWRRYLWLSNKCRSDGNDSRTASQRLCARRYCQNLGWQPDESNEKSGK